MEDLADSIGLQNLGLTPLQAKIFIALVKYGKQKVQRIAEKIDTDRSNTYQGISQLQKIGLVRKILGSPVIYEAVSLQEGISLLLKQKEIEYRDNKKTAETLLRSLQPSSVSNEDNSEVRMVVNKKEKIENIICKSINSAEKSYDLLLSKRAFCLYVLDLAQMHVSGMKRLKYRILTEKFSLNSQQARNLKIFLRIPNCQIRFLENPPIAQLTIKDGKAANVPLHVDSNGTYTCLLVSNRVCLEMFQNYFNTIWDVAELVS